MIEENLIFLISQPRSGSSLVQQLILSESSVASTAEPWQMLTLIPTYKEHDIRSSYNPRFAVINFNRYLETEDNGLDNYKAKIKQLSLDLYQSHSGGLPSFIDKTPRYYHIINELIDLFPKAKFIFLTRNPLAVFSSIMEYSFKGDVISFLKAEDRLDDLLLAPLKISDAITKHPEYLHITYEDVVKNAGQTQKAIFEFLNFDVPTEVKYQLRDGFIDSTAVDTKSLHKHDGPVTDYLEGWKKAIDSSQKKVAALGYLGKLKTQMPTYLGYDLDVLIKDLENLKPRRKNWFSLSFRILSIKEEKLSILDLFK